MLRSANTVLDRFVADAQAAFGANLAAIVLFGSAAEGALRPTSDINLVVVLRQFDAAAAGRLGQAYQLAQAAARLSAMFLRESEIPAAAAAFAVKFLDIAARRRVLFGDDPFATLAVPRDAVEHRVKQVLLNLELRLREQFVAASGQPERLVRALAETAGPLRAAAAALCWLDGKPVSPPKAALAAIANDLAGGPWDDLLAAITAARTQAPQPEGSGPGEPVALFARLVAMTDALRRRAGG
jgi:predicted nucleotidyltransferase